MNRPIFGADDLDMGSQPTARRCVLCGPHTIFIILYQPIKKSKKSKAVPLHTMETHGGESRYSSYSFLTSALDEGEWSASRPGRALPPGKEHPVPIG
jgi:hypothetical protein